MAKGNGFRKTQSQGPVSRTETAVWTESPRGRRWTGLCGYSRAIAPLAGPLPVLPRPSRAALCRDACGAFSIPPCSGQQRAGGLRTHCCTSLPRPSTNLELATTGAAGAGGDPSPACPWPGPPSAGHTGIQRGRCEVPPGSGPASGGQAWGVLLPQDICSYSPGTCRICR